jgi:hypothetical protein
MGVVFVAKSTDLSEVENQVVSLPPEIQVLECILKVSIYNLKEHLFYFLKIMMQFYAL